jgi:hypothetical protein
MSYDNESQEHFKFVGPGTYTVRHGEALPEQPPRKIVLSGDIDTVRTFLRMRYLNNRLKPQGRATDVENEDGDTYKVLYLGTGRQWVNPQTAIIEIDREGMDIVLLMNPEDFYGPEVRATLRLSPELEQFKLQSNGISKGVFKRDEIVQMLKFSRLHFANREAHTTLLRAYETFEAKVDLEIKQSADQRGSRENALRKVVTTALPHEFTLHIPIFKGQKRETFRVEIAFDVTEGGARFWFESVELAELVQERRDEIFDEMAKEWADEFVIINK